MRLGGGGVPHLSAKGFLEKWFSVKGVGEGGYPLNGQNLLSSLWKLPLYKRKKLCLWSVGDLLDDCDAELDVGEVVQHVEPADDADDRQDQSHSDEYRDASENC